MDDRSPQNVPLKIRGAWPALAVFLGFDHIESEVIFAAFSNPVEQECQTVAVRKEGFTVDKPVEEYIVRALHDVGYDSYGNELVGKSWPVAYFANFTSCKMCLTLSGLGGGGGLGVGQGWWRGTQCATLGNFCIIYPDGFNQSQKKFLTCPNFTTLVCRLPWQPFILNILSNGISFCSGKYYIFVTDFLNKTESQVAPCILMLILLKITSVRSAMANHCRRGNYDQTRRTC